MNPETLPRIDDGALERPGRHAVQFYEDDDSVAATVDRMIGPALTNGASAIIVATPTHRRLVRRALADRGADVAALAMHGRCTMLDAGATLQRLMNGNHIDARAFTDVIGGQVQRATVHGNGQHVRAFGEMVGLLHEEGQTAAALELEARWDELLGSAPLSLLCAYPARSFSGPQHVDSFMHVCGAHDHVISNDRGAAVHAADGRLAALSQIDTLPRASVSLLHVVRDAASGLQPIMRARGQILVVGISPSLEVDGNARWLTQMFYELLDNASKFTPTGVIAVTAEGRDTLVVSVVGDDGVGIAPELLEAMFDPFTQIDRPLTQRPDDLGLGLAIVRRIVELHDGTVTAESDGRCRGARIVVTLPRA